MSHDTTNKAPEKPAVSSPSPRRVTNPSGSRIAAPARTLPPAPVFHFLTTGAKPTADEWAALQAFFQANPSLRLKRGQPIRAGENRFFISYHRDYPNGERWGTKEQLAKSRLSVAKNAKRSRKRRMKSDPAFREAQEARLASLVTRREALEGLEAEELEARRAKRLKKAIARKRAVASIRRKAKAKSALR